MTFKKITEEDFEEKIDQMISKRSSECKFCFSKVRRSLHRENEVVCTFKSCKKRYNIWEDTIFTKSKIGVLKTLKILEQWLLKSPRELNAYNNEVSEKCVCKVISSLRKSVVPKFVNTSEKIGGNNMIVEIDESKFGKRKYNRGHKVEGVWVLGLVERSGERRIKLLTLVDRKKDTLLELIKEHVRPDSIIYTDCWKGYIGLEEHFIVHSTVNHSKNFVDPDTSTHTNTIEGNWNGVKMQTPYINRTEGKITLYLMRYMLLRDKSAHPLFILLKYLFYFFFLNFWIFIFRGYFLSNFASIGFYTLRFSPPGDVNDVKENMGVKDKEECVKENIGFKDKECVKENMVDPNKELHNYNPNPNIINLNNTPPPLIPDFKESYYNNGYLQSVGHPFVQLKHPPFETPYLFKPKIKREEIDLRIQAVFGLLKLRRVKKNK